MTKYKVNQKTLHEEPSPGSVSRKLYRLSWRNWFFLVGVLAITTTGLATAIPPLLSKRITNPWPWAKTDLVLLAGLSIMVLAVVIYLTRQQMYVLRIHRKLHRLQDKAHAHAKRHYSRLFALLNLSRIMGSETSLQNVFDCITETCLDTFTCQRASLMLFDKQSQMLIVRSASGQSSSKLKGRYQKIGEGISGWAAKHREALFLTRNCDLTKYPGLNVKDLKVMAAMVVPIIVRDELVGILNVSTELSDVDYDEEDLKALQVFAENAGVCIRHTEQSEWMRITIQNLQGEKGTQPKRPIANNAGHAENP